MQPIKSTRHDPAPSRIAYRIQRLWLTPVFRSVLRAGIPAAIVLGSGGWYLSDETRVENLRLSLTEMRSSVEQRPEFMVNLMRIENVSDEVAEDIREITAIDFPISSFDLDLKEMRTSIQELDAVDRADLVVRAGGVLEVEVIERVPAIIWRGRDTLELLDEGGHRVSALERRTARADLPLIAGERAHAAVPEAMAIFAVLKPVGERVRGLLRVGERRWDVVLDRNQRIMLPETDPVRAVERVLALNEINELLSRDLVAIDLRNQQRPIIRLTPEAVDALNAIKTVEDGDDA